MTDVPAGLRVTCWRSAGESVSIPARTILSWPRAVQSRYDGFAYWDTPDSPPLIRFRLFGWDGMVGSDAMPGLACRLAGHLAGTAEGWPCDVAHTVLLPVIDWSYVFEVTPAPRRLAPLYRPPGIEKLLASFPGAVRQAAP